MKHCPFHDTLIGDLQMQIRSLTEENDFFVNSCLRCMDCLNITCPIRYRRKNTQSSSNLGSSNIIDINTRNLIDY